MRLHPQRIFRIPGTRSNPANSHTRCRTALAGYLLDATQGSYTVDRMFVQYCGSQIGLADEKELGEAAVTANLFARTAAVAALYAVLPAKLEAQGMQPCSFSASIFREKTHIRYSDVDAGAAPREKTGR